MAEPDETEVREWLTPAAAGDAESWRLLLAYHHDRLRRMVAVLAAAFAGGSADRPSEAAARGERQRRLQQQILEAMDPIDREVLALRYFEELSLTEAALVLGVSEKAAHKQHVRALGRLRQALAAEPGGLEGWLP
jgi:RNA polymerase sigma-70 factor (ECF subfamily)